MAGIGISIYEWFYLTLYIRVIQGKTEQNAILWDTYYIIPHNIEMSV